MVIRVPDLPAECGLGATGSTPRISASAAGLREPFRSFKRPRAIVVTLGDGLGPNGAGQAAASSPPTRAARSHGLAANAVRT
jgi:hypothetical protein